MRIARSQAALAIFVISALVASCGGSDGPGHDPGSSREGPGGNANAIAAAPASWGEMLLELIPGKLDSNPVSAETVRATLTNCAFGRDGAAAFQADCSAVGTSQAPGVAVRVVIGKTDGPVAAVRLTACCGDGDEFFQPLANERIIRTELMCPEITIVASDSAKTFRISAPGKRDVLYLAISNVVPTGKSVSHTFLLAPGEGENECAALASAEIKLDTQIVESSL